MASHPHQSIVRFIIARDDLSIYEAMLLIVIADFASKSGQCTASQKTLAKRAKMSTKQVQRGRSSMLLKGFLRVVGRNGDVDVLEIVEETLSRGGLTVQGGSGLTVHSGWTDSPLGVDSQSRGGGLTVSVVKDKDLKKKNKNKTKKETSENSVADATQLSSSSLLQGGETSLTGVDQTQDEQKPVEEDTPVQPKSRKRSARKNPSYPVEVVSGDFAWFWPIYVQAVRSARRAVADRGLAVYNGSVKGEKTSHAVFERMRKAKQLPPFKELCASVRKWTTSPHWLSGYIPNMYNWLDEECWRDDIYVSKNAGKVIPKGKFKTPDSPNTQRRLQMLFSFYSEVTGITSLTDAHKHQIQEGYEALVACHRAAQADPRIAPHWYPSREAFLEDFLLWVRTESNEELLTLPAKFFNPLVFKHPFMRFLKWVAEKRKTDIPLNVLCVTLRPENIKLAVKEGSHGS